MPLFAAQVGGGCRRVPTILNVPPTQKRLIKAIKIILRSKQLNLVTKYEIYVEISLNVENFNSFRDK